MISLSEQQRSRFFLHKLPLIGRKTPYEQAFIECFQRTALDAASQDVALLEREIDGIVKSFLHEAVICETNLALAEGVFFVL